MRWPWRPRKSRRERVVESLLAVVPMSRRELLARIRDTSQDTSRLSFASGLVLGLIVGVIVALVFALRESRPSEDVRNTDLELRPREEVDALNA